MKILISIRRAKNSFLVCFILLSATFAESKSNSTAHSSVPAKQYWCCNHPDHRALNLEACTVTNEEFSTYSECNKKKAEHEKAFPKHKGSSGCRPG